MTASKAKTAQQVVTDLIAAGVQPSPALEVAVKQKWTLPEGTIAELKAQLADVHMPNDLPTPEALFETNFHADMDACKAEAARLVRNAKTNDWRNRTRLQAAIDARSLKATAAAKGKGHAPAAPAAKPAAKKAAKAPEKEMAVV